MDNVSQSRPSSGAAIPVGIGPVLAGWDAGKPVYYADLIYAGGETKRMVWEKCRPGADRTAKNEGYNWCNRLAASLRTQGTRVARLYDESSFEAVAALLRRPP